jgi:hypothetical protein
MTTQIKGCELHWKDGVPSSDFLPIATSAPTDDSNPLENAAPLAGADVTGLSETGAQFGVQGGPQNGNVEVDETKPDVLAPISASLVSDEDVSELSSTTSDNTVIRQLASPTFSTRQQPSQRTNQSSVLSRRTINPMHFHRPTFQLLISLNLTGI